MGRLRAAEACETCRVIKTRVTSEHSKQKTKLVPCFKAEKCKTARQGKSRHQSG